MPRSYKNKTERITASLDLLKNAIDNIINNCMSIRDSSKEFNISKSKLQRCVQRFKNGESVESIVKVNEHKFIFNEYEENELVKYLLKASSLHHGLNVNETRSLAYQYAIKNKIKIPSNWTKNEKAGCDWFYSFIKRHKKLSIRTPEATSLSRATSFNQTNVLNFFKNQEDFKEGQYVIVKYQSEKKRELHFVGLIIKNMKNKRKLKMTFLKKKIQKNMENVFLFTEPEDIDVLQYETVVSILEPPVTTGLTARAKNTMIFNDVNLEKFKLH